MNRRRVLINPRAPSFSLYMVSTKNEDRHLILALTKRNRKRACTVDKSDVFINSHSFMDVHAHARQWRKSQKLRRLKDYAKKPCLLDQPRGPVKAMRVYLGDDGHLCARDGVRSASSLITAVCVR